MPIFGLVSLKIKQEVSGLTMYNVAEKIAGSGN